MLHPQQAQGRTNCDLGFYLEQADGEPVVELGGIVPRAILKTGSAYSYVIGYGIEPISRHELKEAGITKSRVIDALASGSEDLSMLLFEKAKEIAFLELSEKLGAQRATFLAYLIAHDTVGYGAISVLLEDKAKLEEIEINAPTAPLLVHHAEYGTCKTNLLFSSASHFRLAVNKMAYEAEKELNDSSPIVDVQVGDARVHAQIKPYAQSGGAATIRLGSANSVGIDYLIKKGSATDEELAYLWLAIDSKVNMLVSGAPASGKTTMLSVLMSLIPMHQRVATIEEDISELRAEIDFNNVVALYGSKYGGVSAREQVINALRMRPERLIVGEIRGDEAKEMFAGANLGIPFLTTMHSNEGAVEILKRLLAKPMGVDQMTLSMLDVAIYMKQVDISRRIVSGVYEYKWLSRAETESGIDINESNSVQIDELSRSCSFNRGALSSSKVIKAYAKLKGITVNAAIREFDRRVKFIKKLSEQGSACSNAIELVRKYEEGL
ncbi:MAG: type II/IV secretion system ATPase subunit [Candidatus Micrarchaeaceae archaeon]